MIAPSGRPHVGNLRGLIHLDTWSHELTQIGYQCRKVLVIHDYHVLTKTKDPLLRKFVNTKFTEIPCPKRCCSSYSSHYTNEILVMLRDFNINFSKILLGSEIARRPTFKAKILESLKKEKIINNILAHHQKSPFQLFYVQCDNCGKLYGSKMIFLDTKNGDIRYRCNFCGHYGETNITKNEGKLKFKLETALIWKELEVNIDFEGIDEQRALNCSKEIFEILFGIPSPIHFMFNLVLTVHNKKMSKSLGIGFPATRWKKIADPGALRHYFIKAGSVPMIYFDISKIPKIIDRFDVHEKLFQKGCLTNKNLEIFQMARITKNLPGKRSCKIPFDVAITIVRHSPSFLEQRKKARSFFFKKFGKFPSSEEEKAIDIRLKQAKAFINVELHADDYEMSKVESNNLKTNLLNRGGRKCRAPKKNQRKRRVQKTS